MDNIKDIVYTGGEQIMWLIEQTPRLQANTLKETKFLLDTLILADM